MCASLVIEVPSDLKLHDPNTKLRTEWEWDQLTQSQHDGTSTNCAGGQVTLGGKANLAVWEAKWPSTKIAPFSRVHVPT